MIWLVGGKLYLRVGKIRFEPTSKSFVVEVPVNRPQSLMIDQFPDFDTAVDSNRLVLLRLLKRMMKFVRRGS